MDTNHNLSEEVLPQIKELTEDEENILEKNIVWIFGARRSGNTWLGEKLLYNN